MKIRIESDHDNLKEIHQLIYEADATLEIEEDYKSTPGMQLEPGLIGIISTLSPIVVTAITAWVTNRKNQRDAELEKAKLETERERISMLYDLTKTKLILEKDNTKTIEITANEFEELDKFLPPHDKNVKE
ncbi:hypothetical protein SAMN05192574_105280 [Mucilaginibacter gossypiicola]|uniref:Uncharacterized protein n=1 Tax=Mucilaginibacter gossypiicola TaxID=551995 RepID=A0A1H8LWH4_9SPHI|nr:hypothetical protein [Mucilaginibacter gossypiicola]SEO09453.1 hypothetical protein SAMN05192574_105280 [Mucilaginibacter gossypiicola]